MGPTSTGREEVGVWRGGKRGGKEREGKRGDGGEVRGGANPPHILA